MKFKFEKKYFAKKQKNLLQRKAQWSKEKKKLLSQKKNGVGSLFPQS